MTLIGEAERFTVDYTTAQTVLFHAMEDPRIEPLHRVGRALSDPTRCRILLCLLHEPHYPTELARHLGLSKANVSNHLAFLRECELVTAIQEGRRQRYELCDARLAHALEDLAALAAEVGVAPSRVEGVAL